MQVNGWFPKINAFGDIASGDTDVFITHRDGRETLVGKGGGPQWTGQDSLVYNGRDQTTKLWPSGEEVAGAYNAYDANELGDWAGFYAVGDGRLDVYAGRTLLRSIPGATGPRWFGTKLAYMTPYQTDPSFLRSIIVGGVDSFRGVVFTFDGPPLIVCIATGTYTRQMIGTPTLYEDETLIRVRDGWTMSWSNVVGGMLLRPIGEVEGYFIVGDKFNPDMRRFGDTMLIASSSAAGILQRDPIDLRQPRRDLRTLAAAPPPPPPPPPPPLEKHMLMPREVYDVLAAVAAKFKSMHQSANEDDRREAMKRGIETVHARIPGSERWQHKAGGSGNAPSKDAAAFVPEDPIEDRRQVRMFMFDTVNGSSREMNPYPLNGEEGNQWIVLVGAKDWLAGADAPPADATHRYIGGGNDTNECDSCHRSRFDPVHAVPESKTRHDYDGGEQDTGLCDICQLPRTAEVHQRKEEPTVEAHDFVGGQGARFCSTCGKPREDAIHQKAPAPGGTTSMEETNQILRDLLASSKRQEQQLDALREAFIKGTKDLAGDLTKALPSLLDLLRRK